MNHHHHHHHPPGRDTPLPFNPGGLYAPASSALSLAAVPTPEAYQHREPNRIVGAERASSFIAKPRSRQDATAVVHSIIASSPPPTPSFPPPATAPLFPPPPKFTTPLVIPPIGYFPGCWRGYRKTRTYALFPPAETQGPVQPDPFGPGFNKPHPALITPSPTRPVPPIQGCTTTVSQTAASPCSWNGTQTIYPSTTTMYRGINCHGCTDVSVRKRECTIARTTS